MGLSKSIQDQLHRQYAENENSRTKTIISFIGTLSFVFVAYGAAINQKSEDKTIIGAISLLVSIIITMLSVYCIYLGYSIRRDQYIVFNIRKKAMGIDYDKIFDKLYNPRNKDILSFLPDTYLILYGGLLVIHLLLLCYTIVKLKFCNVWIPFLGLSLIASVIPYFGYHEKYHNNIYDKSGETDKTASCFCSCLRSVLCSCFSSCLGFIFSAVLFLVVVFLLISGIIWCVEHLCCN